MMPLVKKIKQKLDDIDARIRLIHEEAENKTDALHDLRNAIHREYEIVKSAYINETLQGEAAFVYNTFEWNLNMDSYGNVYLVPKVCHGFNYDGWYEHMNDLLPGHEPVDLEEGVMLEQANEGYAIKVFFSDTTKVAEFINKNGIKINRNFMADRINRLVSKAKAEKVLLDMGYTVNRDGKSYLVSK